MPHFINYLNKKLHFYFLLLYFFTAISQLYPCDGFAIGTLVKIPGGFKKIEALKEGDIVSSYDFSGSKKTFSEAQISKIIHTKISSALQLYVGSTRITTTTSQSFYSPGTGWISAQSITDDRIIFSAPAGAKQIQHKEKVHGEFEIISLTVSGTHTFFVSEKELLVHNSPEAVVSEIVQAIAPTIPAPIFSVVLAMGMIAFTLFKQIIDRDEEEKIRQIAKLEIENQKQKRQEEARN
jgi:hypothetical protein